MAAFVVVPPPATASAEQTGMQLSIFPGSPAPTIFPANAPFWIGCGFVADLEDARAGVREELSAETRFELEVDSEPVPVRTNVKLSCGRTVSKLGIASFAQGLPAGWHRFAGRWYDAGKLVLTSDRSIEFVER